MDSPVTGLLYVVAYLRDLQTPLPASLPTRNAEVVNLIRKKYVSWKGVEAKTLPWQHMAVPCTLKLFT